MAIKVLIVEDEFLVAVNLEAMIEELGYTSVGIAADKPSALDLAAEQPDIALVDLNLRDGPTGPEIGALLSQLGVSVVYVTANPRMLGQGVPGTLGVISKPCAAAAIGDVLSYAVGRRAGYPTPAPAGVIPFEASTIN